MKKLFKGIALALSCVLAASVLAGCGAKSENEEGKVVISLGDTFPDEKTEPERYERFMETIKRFEEKYPNVKVEDAQWNFSPDTFLAKAEAGTLPTVYYVPFTEANNMMKLGYAADLTEYLEERGYVEKMNDFILGLISEDNKIYFLPEQTNYTVGIAVNLEMYKKAGYVAEDGTLYQPETWEDLAEVAKKIKETTGADGFIFPTTGNVGGWRFTPVAWSYGTVFETQQDDGSWKATFNSPECAKALQFVSDLKWKYNVLPENALVSLDDTKSQFAAGNVAMTFAEPNFIDSAVNSFKLDINNIGMIQLPAGDKRKVSLIGGGLRVIDSNSTPEQIEAALNFLTFIGLGADLDEEKKVSINDSIESRKENGLMVGLDGMSPWKADSDYMVYKNSVIEENKNINIKNIELYNNSDDLETQAEEPIDAQALYAVLDNVIQEVFTNKDADIEKLLDDAANKFQKNNLDYAK